MSEAEASRKLRTRTPSRGGSWGYSSKGAKFAYHISDAPYIRDKHLGIRLVEVIDE